MRLIINKTTKNVLISIIVVLIIFNTYLLYRVINTPYFEEFNTTVYEYKSLETIDYQVYLKPNSLYNDDVLENEDIYITEFIDYINTNFIYEINGERKANIEGRYNILAKVQGLTGRDEELVTIWEKNFPIIRNKNFKTMDGQVSLNEEVKLYLDEYNTFVKETIEATKINCDTTLTLLMDINLTGTTDQGTFEEHITPSIVIPLNTPTFEITTNNVDKPGAIEETIQVELPIDKGKVIFYGVIIGISALGLIFLIFFTVPAPKKSPLEKELNKILKKHGDRLVALKSDVSQDIRNAKYVRTIDDLVRFADEVERPILYKYSDNYKEIDKFYVANGDEIYVFDIVDSLAKDEILSEETETTVKSD